ncbi:MAG: hypothetical protein KAI24_17500, partial [Planctomycetes bacterium]|nr:hypothetical protein [Planctomycetota bacterium]
MSERDDVQERLFDVLLGEVEGRGPDDRLVARTLASVERPERGMAAAATARSPRWLLVAAVLAVGVVATLAVVTQGEGAVGRGAGAGDEATMGAGGDAAPQDPRARTPEQCIEALRDDGQRDAAVRELARGGPQAVRVMIAALGDAEAPREHVLAAIEQMGAGAAAALPAITALIRATPKHDAVLGPAVSAAATLAPFGSEVERHDARRAVLFLAFIDNGPADGGAVVKRARAGGGGGAGPAQRKGPAFSMRDVARLLHRIELPREASTEALLAALAGDSPYGRELAAQLLVGHDSPQVREALRDAVIA